MEEKFGSYIILQEFGDGGGGGDVWLAENEKDKGKKIEEKTMYVVKTLKKDFDETEGKCLNKEIKILNKLPDKNFLPKVYEYRKFNENDINKNYKEKPYYVMDLYSKGSLFYYAHSKLLSESKHCKLLFKKIIEGFKYLHDEKHISHLDIKVENILFDKNFEPVIIDFGSAEEFTDPDKEIDFETKLITRQYACPKILERKKYIPVKADVFSLGVLLFNLVTGGFGFLNKKKKKEEEETFGPFDYLYTFIKENNIDGYWDALRQVNDAIEKEKDKINLDISEEFKKLYIKMVAYEPLSRPSLDDVLSDPWLKEINDIFENKEEKKNLEIEYKNEFLSLCGKIDENDKEILLAADVVKAGYKTKGPGEKEGGLFEDMSIRPKKIPKDRMLINHYVKIEGYLSYENQIDFMNNLAKKIFDELGGTCELLEENLKFKVDFGKNEENGITEMIIELFEYEDGGYLIEFLRTKGNIPDYYHYFKEIKKLIKEVCFK